MHVSLRFCFCGKVNTPNSRCFFFVSFFLWVSVLVSVLCIDFCKHICIPKCWLVHFPLQWLPVHYKQMKVCGDIRCLAFILLVGPSTAVRNALCWSHSQGDVLFLGLQISLADVSFFLHYTWMYETPWNADRKQLIIKISICNIGIA